MENKDKILIPQHQDKTYKSPLVLSSNTILIY